MARWVPMQLVGGAYADDALPWSSQDCVNYIPVPAEKEGTRSREMLRCLPGYNLFCDLGTNKPIRGARNVEGRLFVVSGTTLFQVNADGSSTERGTIPGVTRCSLSHNQITGGNEVVISNGQGGYVYDTAANTLEQITDDGFAGAISFDFVDGYILGIEPARRFAFTSDLAAATSYNTLDRYEAEGSPDLLVGQAVTHREWWLMGERTIEPFVNTGAATGTFQRSQGTVIEVGLAATHAVAIMDNSVFWLGSDGIVYRANGYTPQRISTHAIEQAIARCNMAQAFAFTFEDRGHKVFYLTFPDGHTWGYDAATGEWHRRKSHGLDRWRINTLVKWNNKWIAGDFSNGRLYQLGWDVQDEAGEVLERRRVTGVTHDNQNALIINGLELAVDTGIASSGSSSVAPSALSITGNLPDGASLTSTSYQYTINAALRPVAVSISAGALPAGLSIDTDGLVTGTFGAGGTYNWTVQVTDAVGNTATVADGAVVTPVRAAYFDGTGDYLAAPFTPPIIATGDFTIQAWVSPSVSGSGCGLLSGRNSNIRGWAAQVNGNGAATFRQSMNTGLIDSTTNVGGGTVPINKLTHVAYTRHGNVFTTWVNGTAVATKTLAGSIDETSVNSLDVGTSYAGTLENILKGYVYWLTMNIGTCLYTENFEPDTNVDSVSAPDIKLAFDEAVGSTTFADTGSRGLTWTTTGNVVIAEYPF